MEVPYKVKDGTLTWERIWSCNEVVRSKHAWRFISLIAQIKPNSQNLCSVEVYIVGREELQLHLKVSIIIEEGILNRHRTRTKVKLCPQAYLQRLEDTAVRQVPEERRPENHQTLVWIGASTTPRIQTLIWRAYY